MKTLALRCWTTGLLLSLVGAFVLSPAGLRAGETEDFNFAKKLQRDRLHAAAAEEFLRFAERYPQSALRPDAIFSAGESFMQAAKAAEALTAFDDFIKAYPQHEKACTARLQRGRILKALKRYKEAAGELLAVPDAYPGCTYVDQALLDAGESLIAGGDFEEAAKVLRRLIERKDSEITPRARYTLAVALRSAGKDREAEGVLGEIVAKHQGSPVRALALLELGERTLDRKEIDKAEGQFRAVLKEYEEEPIVEKAMVGLLKALALKGAHEAAFTEAERYLSKHKTGSSRPWIEQQAITAAARLKKYDKALALIDARRGGSAQPDSTGEFSLMAARIRAEQGRTAEAAAELAEMRRRHPRSPLLGDALLFEAELRERQGNPAEAARLLSAALSEGASGAGRIAVLSRLADLSASKLHDTLSAVRYWETIVAEDRDGAAAEEAIWKESLVREALGDYRGASAGYDALVSRFSGSAYAGQAAERRAALALRPRWSETAVRALARIAASADPASIRAVETGAILLEEAGDAESAIGFLEAGLGANVPDSTRAKGSCILGRAYLRRAAALRSQGSRERTSLDRGLELLQETARKYPRSVWGERAQREYLASRLSELEPRERLRLTNEYLAVYGRSEGRAWALTEKVRALSGVGAQGDTAAVDSALALAASVLSSTGSAADKREISYEAGYLYRQNRDLASAARVFEQFVAAYPGDPRVIQVLYDLGEAFLSLKDYAKAEAAYDACLAKAPGRALAEKCVIRKGDCLYYRGLFAESADAYARFPAAYPQSGLVAEAAYREALARDKAADQAAVDTLLAGIVARKDAPSAVRGRALSWLASRSLARQEFAAARRLYGELTAIDPSAANMVLAAEAELGALDFAAAAKTFTDALKIPGADTCRIVAGRTKAYLRLKDGREAARGLEWLARGCAGRTGLAEVALEKARMEVDDGRCAEADSTLRDLRRRYPGGEEAAQALYWQAVCDIKRGAYRDAIDRIESFLRESPHTPMLAQAYFKLGSAHFAAGNINLAAKNFALAAESAQDRSLAFLAYKNLGRVYQDMEDWASAAATWQKVLDLFPEEPEIVEVFFDLGFCYNQSGRNELAYEVYTRIPEISRSEEQEGRAYYWAGMSLKNLGKCDGAVREFLRVPYLKTGGMWGVTAKLEAASCYEQLGDLDQAGSIYEAVLAAHGENSDWGRIAKDGLARIASARAKGAAGAPGGGADRKE